jgi:hypothetical protein
VLGARTVEELVAVPRGVAQHAVTLVLPPEQTGRLRLALVGARGEPVRSARVTLSSALLGEPLDGFSDRAIDGSAVLEDVPAGAYSVTLLAGDESDDDPLLLPETVHDEVVIRPGATTELVRALPAGAGLVVALDVDGPLPEGFALVLDPATHPDQAARERAAHEGRRGALVTLRPAAGAARALAFVVPPEAPGRVAGVAGTLLPGRSARVHGALPPGEYVLRVEAPGFAPVERPLVLRAGERAEVRLALRVP